MKFSNDEYVRSHGKRPSGRGSWAFGFNGRTYIAPANLTLPKAKIWLRTQIHAATCGFVVVLP